MYIIFDETGSFYKTDLITEDEKIAFQSEVIDIINVDDLTYMTDVDIWKELPDWR